MGFLFHRANCRTVKGRLERMNITFKQTIIKGILKRRLAEESIKTDVVPDVGDYVKIGNIEGKVDYRSIDYNSNYITVWVTPRDARDIN